MMGVRRMILAVRATALMMGVFLAAGTFLAAPVHAADVFDAACQSAPDSAVCKSQNEGATREEAAGEVQEVVNLVLFLLGIAAVIMIIYGGFRYVLARGDQSATQDGKNTILYAVIGLVVAILSYAIVNFFIFGLSGGE